MQRWLRETAREQPYNGLAAVEAHEEARHCGAGETSQAEYLSPSHDSKGPQKKNAKMI